MSNNSDIAQTETIILHTNHDSSPTWRVRIVLALKGVTFERKFHKFDELLNAPYTEVNPLGQIPALEIDSETLTQSLAIIDYLDEKYPQPKLLPTDLKKRAKAREIAEIINSGTCIYSDDNFHGLELVCMGRMGC